MLTHGTQTKKQNCQPGCGNKKSARIADLFSLLGTDSRENIKILTAQTLKIIGGEFSLYQGSIQAGANLPQSLETDLLSGETLFKKSATDKILIIQDTLTKARAAQDPLVKKFNLRSIMGIPVLANQELVGVLWLADTSPREFTADERHALQCLADALGLEESRLVEVLPPPVSELQGSRIQELEQQLNQAKKMELIGIVAGGVAHDLNNILAGLVSYPELILLQLDQDSPLKDPISFMLASGLRAADIVQDLLTLTRRGFHQKTIVSLARVVKEYFDSSAHFRLTQNHPEIRFTLDVETDLLHIKGSEVHVSKTIMNLIMNAAEAVQKEGAVDVCISNRYVDLNSDHGEGIREGEYVVLKVRDNGEGICKTDLKRIFEPFYTTKKMGRSGSGLGLSVVWNAVKDHDGHIEVKSEKESGTQFELFFPATREALRNEPNPFQLASVQGKKEHILVIDDVESQRKIAEECLTLLGYTAFSVESGESAIAFLKKKPMDLLILDMKMEPGIDGLETFEKILKINPSQKAIIASGYSETDRVRKTLGLGAGQYIKKPYTIKKLALALKKELT